MSKLQSEHDGYVISVRTRKPNRTSLEAELADTLIEERFFNRACACYWRQEHKMKSRILPKWYKPVADFFEDGESGN